jgi:2,4-dienoyl-CoA reductase-like NADH-dependent reductase (Old Yellow Enzyme family)
MQATLCPAKNKRIFEKFEFRNLPVKNRLFRSSISGRIDNYNGSGTPARVSFEEKFAKGGVGAIISSHVPIRIDSRVLPNYATIDCDKRIPFWEEVRRRVHKYNCKYIVQLSMSGRQQDIGGIENQEMREKGLGPLSATGKPDLFNGLPCKAMTTAQIDQAIQDFARAARRVVKAGLDGIELHSSNGYLFNQFMSSAINDRKDEYGGSLSRRAKFLLNVMDAIRAEVGREFFLSVKLSVIENDNATLPWPFYHIFPEGNTKEESIQIAKWAAEHDADAIHVSAGSMFPHPRNPAGPFPLEIAWKVYQSVIASGKRPTYFGLFQRTFLNYLVMRYRWLHWVVPLTWGRTQKDFLDKNGEAIRELVEGINVPAAHDIKEKVKIPVICTGGFQTAKGILHALDEGCAAVSIARPLLANPNLPILLEEGWPEPPKPCSYCNRCLLNVIEHPPGCYDERRFNSYEEMIETIMDQFPDKTNAPTSWGWLPY